MSLATAREAVGLLGRASGAMALAFALCFARDCKGPYSGFSLKENCSKSGLCAISWSAVTLGIGRFWEGW